MQKSGWLVWAGAVLMTAPLAAQTMGEWGAMGAGNTIPLQEVKYNALPDDEQAYQADATEEMVEYAATQASCNEPACGCDDGGCTESCGCESCGCQECCCEPYFKHRCSVWAGFLYLHASDVDMVHAIQANGTGGAGTVPDGRVGTVQPDYEPGFTIGGSAALSDCSSIWASYTHYESNEQDFLDSPAGVGGNVGSLVLHPGTINAGTTFNQVGARYDIDFDLADVNFSHLLAASNHHYVNYHAGVRYATLDQKFNQFGAFAPGNSDVITDSAIDFEGVGPRFGLDGRTRLGRGGFSAYGNLFLSLLIGNFDSKYSQFDQTIATREAYATWEDNRIVPQLETELGLSWQTCSGCFRVSAGYQLQWWFNSITTADFVKAVQDTNAETGILHNGYTNVGDTIAFDGLTGRVEVRF